jgi:hypothetical protein
MRRTVRADRDEPVSELQAFCTQMRGRAETDVRREYERRFPQAGAIPALWAAIARGEDVRIERVTP